MEINELYKLYMQSFEVSTDTRKIEKGCMFFALKGENFNGNKFANEALEKGASVAVVDEKEYASSEDIILVGDVLSTLQQLATYHRLQLGIPILALTGSNGKTTTKELFNAVLSKKFRTSATKGNLNNHIGVPLTLLSMNPDTEFGIVEMGANHLGEIAFLCKITQPDYGYITNFGKAHLEGFGSLEGVIKGKTELYTFLRTHGKKVFINADDSKQIEMSKGMDRISFGHALGDTIISPTCCQPLVAAQYDTHIIQSNLMGSYNFTNIAAAIAVGKYFDVPTSDIKDAIEHYQPENNRSQVIRKGSNTIILDAYNANPTSMEAAIANLKSLKVTKKVVILGDMFELGKDTDVEHKEIIRLVTAQGFDQIYLIGKHFFNATDNTKEEVTAFETFEEFKTLLKKDTFSDTTLLIKASRGMALERILEYI